MTTDPLTLAVLVLVVVAVGVLSAVVWRVARRRNHSSRGEVFTPTTKLGNRGIFPPSGLLIPEGILRELDITSAAMWEALEAAGAPVALEYHSITDVELATFRTIPVNATMQQGLSHAVKTLNPNSATLYRVVIPKGANLVRAVGADGYRGLVRNASGIASHAVLKPVAIGGAIAAGWPIFAVAGTVLILDMAAQREIRAHQRRVEGLLGRQEERYYIERVKDQRSADAQLSRAIALVLDGRHPNLELALKSADDEFHRAQQFLHKYRGVLDALEDANGKVDFRRLEEVLGGKLKDTDYFVRELHLARVAIALRRKALIADAAAVALVDPANPYAALRRYIESQAYELQEADGDERQITERLARMDLKGRWYDKVTGIWHGSDKSVVARQRRFRSQIEPPAVDDNVELRFIATPSGEVRQIVSSNG
jgi:hypothetical protein